MNGALKHMGLALVGLSAIGGLFVLPASAQNTNPNQALPGLGGSDQNSDAFGGTDGVNMYDLFHRLQMGPMPSMSEFNREQQRTINSAASDFRARQLELLRQQNPQMQTPQTTPAAPLPSTQPSIDSMSQ
jgi:hypothetical protein